MKTYSIAGLTVNMEAFGRTEKQAEKYLADYTDSADIKLNVSQKAVDKYADYLGTGDKSDGYYLASGFEFYRALLNFDGFMLHSSAVCVDGKAYLFSGQSGVGKSTHTRLWTELLADKCVILNDDKPAIRVMNDGQILAYGTPWSGKTDKNENMGVPLKAICFISRGKQNRIEKLDKKKAAMFIISQCTKNFRQEQWEKILSLIDIVVENIKVYQLYCNTDISAAKLCYDTLSGE